MVEIIGQVVSGKIGRILIRQKSDKNIELGDLIVAEETDGYLILQVYDLNYSSQIPQLSRELIAGMKLEGHGADLDFMEPELRNYIVAEVKVLAHVSRKKDSGDSTVRIPKNLPSFFNTVRSVRKEDFSFFIEPKRPLYFGNLRSGSKILDVDINLDGTDIFTHHLLVSATTGRGKSNLVKVLLWSVIEHQTFGILVLDPHDEYYGRYEEGLKDHPEGKENILYYSPNPPVGATTLVINLRSINPGHFQGIVDFTDAQWDAIELYRNHFANEWVSEIVRGTEIENGQVAPRTLAVLQRKFDTVLGVYLDQNGNIRCRSNVFSDTQGESTVKDITTALEESKAVIIDTSRLTDKAELIIGSIVAGNIFRRYQRYKSEGELDGKPVVSVVVEEAPRVLGGDVLASSGDNIYSTIAKEGRKFKTGLLAITQLTSVIPRTVLANMNTKIILGNEMEAERQALINSASQDLSSDSKAIASLDKGEAIITSSFTKFAVPIKIPLFSEYIKPFVPRNKEKEKIVFRG
ncbi:MAG: ATP-binding protein [Candidatus Odinarchaeota archaeon]